MQASPVQGPPRKPSRLIFSLALALGATTINLWFAAAGWGQTVAATSSDAEPSATQRIEPVGDAHLLQDQPDEIEVGIPLGSELDFDSELVESPAVIAPAAGDLFAQTSDDPQTVDEPIPTEEPIPAEEPLPGEEPPVEVAPPGEGDTIADIQVRFVDEDGQPTEGLTRPFIITREFDLQPGDVYTQAEADEGLQRVAELRAIREADLTLEPTDNPDELVMVVTVRERNPIVVSAVPGNSRARGLFGVVRLQNRNLGGNNQTLALQLEGGERTAGASLSFTDPWIAGDPLRTGYSVNVFNQRSPINTFIGGEEDVDLPNGETPWVHRLGGGFNFFRPVAPDLTVSAGLSYQRVSVRDEAFTDEVSPTDEFGNPLTFSDGGQDDLYLLSLAAIQDTRDSLLYPSEGSALRFGVDQSIPIGDGNILFNRLSASYTRYLPVPLFGFTEGPRTLVFNIQGGTVIGDLPPYEAFGLGGANSVRGYGGGDVASARSFLQATVEYRFPILEWLNGTLFVDYGTDLGSQDTVRGEPGEIRDKPGSGLGYGLGVRVRSPFGPVRLEFGLNDQGDSQLHLRTGERF